MRPSRAAIGAAVVGRFAAWLALTRFDLVLLLFLFAAGGLYHWDSKAWASAAYVGNDQYGDAEFWWSGAIHVAEGIIRENPNITYRMGYAVFAGLPVAVLGTDFLRFHKFLLLLLLLTSAFAYLMLRRSFGCFGAAAATSLFVLSPFTAEWLSISTSDSVGLLLNLLSLICLAQALQPPVRLFWTAAFGFFCSLSSLTRPLMTPFIACALALILFVPGVDWRRKGKAVLVMMTAFVLPLAVCIGSLRAVTGFWALAGTDSTVFYAASDPSVQVWSPSMYEKVAESAKARNNGERPTPAQLRAEFWRLAATNFMKHWRYHSLRLGPHIVEIARFSWSKMNRSSPRTEWSRSVAVALYAGLVGLVLLWRRKLRRLGVVCAVSLAWVLWGAAPLLVLVAAVGAFVYLSPRFYDPVPPMLACYWWTGMAALFVCGGTWGPSSGVAPRLNALGYRLGSQFLFVADWLVVGLIAAAACLEWEARPAGATETPAPWLKALLAPLHGGVSRAVSVILLGLVTGTVLLFATGGAVAAYRVMKRNIEAPQPFPDLAGPVQWLRSNADRWQSGRQVHVATDALDATILASSNAESPYVLFTGATGDFIWNLAGQHRSQAMIFVQRRARPFDMYPNRLLVEFPTHLDEAVWKRRQGAWVLQRFRDVPPPSHIPYYRNEAAVRGFVPLTQDATHFSLERATWFPLTLYASQLVASGRLRVQAASSGFSPTSNLEQFQRRMWLDASADIAAEGLLALTLDLSRVLGQARLAFGYSYELNPSELPRRLQMSVVADRGLIEEDVQQTSSPITPVRHRTFDVTQYTGGTVRLIFRGVQPKDRVWFYEFNLSMSDLAPPRQ